MDNTLKRKNRILDQMLSDGVINQVEYDEAYNEEIKLNIQKVTKRNYIQTFITNSATKALMKYKDLISSIPLVQTVRKRTTRKNMKMPMQQRSRCF